MSKTKGGSVGEEGATESGSEKQSRGHPGDSSYCCGADSSLGQKFKSNNSNSLVVIESRFHGLRLFSRIQGQFICHPHLDKYHPRRCFFVLRPSHPTTTTPVIINR